MINVGEQLVASYLQYIRGCDFTQTNVRTVETQGEIDVLGVDLKNRRAYICEVAVHLTTGLLYVGKDGKSSNTPKLTDKFSRDIVYAEKYLADYERRYMLWSPVVRVGPSKSTNQLAELNQMAANIREKHGVEVEFVVNAAFLAAYEKLREFAAKQTAELKCPLLRMMQLEAYLRKHVAKLPVSNAPALPESTQPAAISLPLGT